MSSAPLNFEYVNPSSVTGPAKAPTEAVSNVILLASAGDIRALAATIAATAV
jgi:hypothetical protein